MENDRVRQQNNTGGRALGANFVPPHQLFPLYTSDNVVKQSYNRTEHRDE